MSLIRSYTITQWINKDYNIDLRLRSFSDLYDIENRIVDAVVALFRREIINLYLIDPVNQTELIKYIDEWYSFFSGKGFSMRIVENETYTRLAFERVLKELLIEYKYKFETNNEVPLQTP